MINYIVKETLELWQDNISYLIRSGLSEEKEPDDIADAILDYLKGEGAFDLAPEEPDKDIKKEASPIAEERVAFYSPSGESLGSYTVRGTFAGELEATKELLAAENGLKPEDIKVIKEGG